MVFTVVYSGKLARLAKRWKSFSENQNLQTPDHEASRSIFFLHANYPEPRPKFVI